MSSKEYWERREREALQHYIKEETEYSKRIREIYDEMLAATQAEIDAFFRKYAKAEGITIAEAKKRVSQLDIKEYERKAKRYVKDREFSKEANEEMRLYNLTMRVNRLEMLKANIGLELLKGTSKLEKFFAEILKGRTMDELKRQAGILGKTIQNNAELAHSIVNASFHNATFSQRLWMQNNAMKADLDKLITSGLISGKNPRELARSIRKYYIGDESLKNGKKGATFYTERLMRTELARVQTDAQKRSFEKNGFELYRFHVNAGCCHICAEVANTDVGYGKGIYRLDKLMPGVNAAPMHPFCRCAISPYEDSEEYEAWLEHLEKGGETEAWGKPTNLRVMSSRKLNRSREIITENDLKDISKSVIINMESYENIVRYFEDSYNIRVVGFEDQDLFSVKAVMAGFDDVLKAFPSARIRKIEFNSNIKDYGNIDNMGISCIGKKGLKSYGTGVHEAIHGLDYAISKPETHSFAESICAKARKNLKLRKNSKEYQKLLWELIGDFKITDDKELLAYAVETELGKGKSTNKLSKEIWEILEKEGAL